MAWCHEVITTRVDQVLGEQVFTRVRWQVLTSIHEAGTITKREVCATMATFIDARQCAEIVDGVVAEGGSSHAAAATQRTWRYPTRARPNVTRSSQRKATCDDERCTALPTKSTRPSSRCSGAW